MKTQKLNLVIMAGLLLLPWNGFTQTKYKLIPDESKMVIHGTSTIHNWEMPAKKFTGEMDVEGVDEGAIQISDVALRVDAKSISSDSRIMDNKTHDALKVDKNPSITFDYGGVAGLTDDEGKFSGTAEGKLSIAGKLNTVQLPFTGVVGKEGKIEVKGSVGIKMSDYGITPPTAMLGALKTGNEVLVEYTFVFGRDSEPSTSETGGIQ